MEADDDAHQLIGTNHPVDIVELRDHDPSWREEFLRERERLTSTLGADALRIDHVGSTAVPGLRAKPIIDIMVSVERLYLDIFVGRLAILDYVYVPIDAEDRLFFRKGLPRTHHLHLVLDGSEEFRKHILFRDRLIANPEEAEEYAALKEGLAQRFRDDREAYTKGKEAFIAGILIRDPSRRI